MMIVPRSRHTSALSSSRVRLLVSYSDRTDSQDSEVSLCLSRTREIHASSALIHRRNVVKQPDHPTLNHNLSRFILNQKNSAIVYIVFLLSNRKGRSPIDRCRN